MGKFPLFTRDLFLWIQIGDITFELTIADYVCADNVSYEIKHHDLQIPNADLDRARF